MQTRAHLGHFVINQGLPRLTLDNLREATRRAKRSVPQLGPTERQHCRNNERDQRLSAEADQAADRADDQRGRRDGPKIGPKAIHAFSRSSSRQPISRRKKPSAKSIWSTARYARARALAKVSATAVTASTRPPFAVSPPSDSAVPAWKTVTPEIRSAASIWRIAPPLAGVPG